MNLVISFPEARHKVEEQAQKVPPPAIEVLPLLESRGRVLAEPITADRDFPPFPRATRDGFAVRAADLAGIPAKLKVIGEIRAGAAPESIKHAVSAGECVEIMTGAPVPAGADAVVMVEHTQKNSGQTVEIRRPVVAGENFVPQGAEGRAGSQLLAVGTRINHTSIAVMASVGKESVRVYAQPKVAVLCTGDELVELSAFPGPHQIRNSNSYSVAAQVAAAGAVPVIFPIAPDNCEGLRQLILRGLNADLLLLTGGVSMGKYDLVEQVLAELRAEMFFTGARIQPGKPVVFGRVPLKDNGVAASRGKEFRYFFGLPGNPVSTMVTFELFARPMIDALSGAVPRQLVFFQARLKTNFRIGTGLTRFLPAVVSGQLENCEVEPLRWHGSGDIAASARANCYLVVPPDREQIAAGETVSILPYN
jgi:molybdopterin molybdotransferase